MFFKLVWLILLLVSFEAFSDDPGFVYYDFHEANVSLDGAAEIIPNGLLRLTNDSTQQIGHAFYSYPIQFKNSSNGNALSFSTTFVFAIISDYAKLSGHGIVFVIAPTRGLPGALPSHNLGLFNESDNGDPNNHVIAVELDTIYSQEFDNISINHVGIDINSLKSNISIPSMYFTDKDHVGRNLSLISGKEMQVWIEYDGEAKELNVTLAPIHIPKPKFPLLSLPLDISPIILDSMYVGFSSSTGSVPTHHYIVAWSFRMNIGEAQKLSSSLFHKLPPTGPKEKPKILTIGIPLIAAILVLTTLSGILFIIRRKRKFAEVLEQWELDYGPHRFSYKDLYIATKGFREKELLGIGGFGKVYRGVLPKSKMEVAVKRISHDSRQGMREFVAETVSIGQLRHRNLVQLLGYCRRKGELLLVYDYMPNGSLDKYIFGQSMSTLNWSQRFRIIKGVASGLFYLHEEWEQVVIHRDIKASNVLLDGELNGRLGDFGLARLYDHGTNPQTTHVVGTLGYLAPEFTRTGKATTSTDVYAFGAFLLEVACGRRPIEPQESADDVVLVDWVFSFWSKGAILEVSDKNLRNCYQIEEMELVLKLGLLCSHAVPMARPSMRQVLQFLEGDIPLPDLSALGLNVCGLTHYQDFDDIAITCPVSLDKASTRSSSGVDSLLSTGR